MNRVPLALFPAFALCLQALSHGDEIPEGYIRQDLEPTGGEILIPKDWFFAEAHRKGAFMWTVSKEDFEAGEKGYETGFRVQFFVGVKKRTDAAPSTQARDFFNSKKEGAAKVHGEFPQVEQGAFSRIGIDVDEGDFRIIYSLFWDDKADLLIVTTAGTPKGQWDEHAEAFAIMGDLVVMDVDKVKAKAGVEPEKGGGKIRSCRFSRGEIVLALGEKQG